VESRHRCGVPPQTSIPPQLRGRPFRLAEALEAGLASSVLRGRRFRRLRRGIYAEAVVADALETQVDAALLVLPGDAVLSHHTAAQLRGLPVPSSRQVHVTLPPAVERSRAGGVRSHEGTPRLVRHDGRALSAPAENFLELAETLCLVDLVVLGDAMVRRGLVTCDELRKAVATTGRRRGVRTARRAAQLVRAGVDSPMETRVRLLVVLAGLPEPEPNVVIRDEVGEWVGVVDLAYPDLKIAIEYHGDVHRTKRAKWRSDVTKAELLRALGWTVIILTADDIESRPERTLLRVRSALVEAGHPKVPAAVDPAWRAHLLPRWARDRQDWARADQAS